MTGVLLKEDCCPEACCLPDGTCDDLPREDCLAQGGTPQGCGTKCADPDIECGDLQACCFPNGSCEDFTPSDCRAAGGTPRGKGTECATTDCGPCATFMCVDYPDILTAHWSEFGGPCCPGGSNMTNELEHDEDFGKGLCKWVSEPLPFLTFSGCPPPHDRGVISRITLSFAGAPHWLANVAILAGGGGFLIWQYVKPCLGVGDTPQGIYLWSSGDPGCLPPDEDDRGMVEVS